MMCFGVVHIMCIDMNMFVSCLIALCGLFNGVWCSLYIYIFFLGGGC